MLYSGLFPEYNTARAACSATPAALALALTGAAAPMLAAVPGWCFCFGVGSVVGPHSPRAYRRSARLRSPSRLFSAPARGEFPQQLFRARRTLAAVRGTSAVCGRLRAGPFVASGCSGPLFARSASGAWPASFGRVPRPLRRGGPASRFAGSAVGLPGPPRLRPPLRRSGLPAGLRPRRPLAGPVCLRGRPLCAAGSLIGRPGFVRPCPLRSAWPGASSRRAPFGASGPAGSLPRAVSGLWPLFSGLGPGLFYARVRLRPLRF